jgi:pilus assembly protein TadC
MEKGDYKKIVVIGIAIIGGIIGFFLSGITGSVFGFLLPLLISLIVWAWRKGSESN